jgi:TolA-binding protein
VGSVGGLKLYADRQEAEANAQLGSALKTFNAYVGAPAPQTLDPRTRTFAAAQEKYKKALEQFTEIVRRFPRQKAAGIARYHMGVCQAELGDQTAAIKTFEEAARNSDRNIVSLAKLALAGEMAKSGKLPEAVKLYQELADHPTSTVPRATALLGLAGAYRATQPAQARQIYERMEKEFDSDAAIAEVVKEEASTLAH